MRPIPRYGEFGSIIDQLDQGRILDEWQILPTTWKTQLRSTNNLFWLYCPNIGAISFDLTSQNVSTYPKEGVKLNVFDQIFLHEWLPLVYQAWGFQVLHASAVVLLKSNAVIAFTADTGKGKSTLGYGLGLRPGWQQISDDALAFKIVEDNLSLYSIPNAIRLRADSANYFQQPPYSHDPLYWPEEDPSLGHIFFIESLPESASSNKDVIQIEPLDGAQAYPLLLKQAYAFTLKLPGHNRRLLHDYLKLASRVKCYRLYYPQTFSILDDLFDKVESQIHEALPGEECLNR